jgi:hypothetical protein
MSYKVFISHANEDKPCLSPVLSSLKVINDVEVLYDDDFLKPGDSISNKAIQGIEGCDLFLLFNSKSALESKYVQQELGAAKIKNKCIVPILLDQTKPEGMINSDTYYVDLAQNETRSSKLMEVVNFIVGKAQQKVSSDAIFAIMMIACAVAVAVYLLKKGSK